MEDKRPEDRRLFDGEYRLMDLIWENEPVRSMELAGICLKALGWKKSTCYTMLKKLSDHGYIKSENAEVTALVKRDQIQRKESEAVVDKSFGGSLPAFVTAFLTGRKLTKEEAWEIREMIEKAVE